MTEENGTTPEQQAQAPGHINISVSPQGMVLSITQAPINLVIDEAGMNQMVTEWLTTHPALFDQLVKQQLTKKQTELALIKNIRESRLN
jgi:hypothetical protein